MTRKCKAACGNELPTASKSETTYHKAKFCGWDCMTEFGIAKAKKDAKPLKLMMQNIKDWAMNQFQIELDNGKRGE